MIPTFKLFALLPLLALLTPALSAPAAPSPATNANATITAISAPVPSDTPQESYKGIKIVSTKSGRCLDVSIPAIPVPLVAAETNHTESIAARAQVPAGGLGDGTELTLLPCDEALMTWDISRGSGSVLLHGETVKAHFPDMEASKEWAIDAGENPQSFGKVKVWTSLPGLTAQTWYYTPDNRIAIEGGDQCLDENRDTGEIQIWKCTEANPQQVFTILHASDPAPAVSNLPTATPSEAIIVTAGGPTATITPSLSTASALVAAETTQASGSEGTVPAITTAVAGPVAANATVTAVGGSNGTAAGLIAVEQPVDGTSPGSGSAGNATAIAQVAHTTVTDRVLPSASPSPAVKVNAAMVSDSGNSTAMTTAVAT